MRGFPPPSRVTVQHALSLRAWALDLLIARDADTRAAPRDCVARDSPETWDLVLRSERCALPLRSRLARGSPPSLPAGPARVLETRATAELQRVLSIRGQLREIQQLATAHHLQPIVLKGGVAALGGTEPVSIDDLDVLVAGEQAGLLGRLLDERGYRPLSAESPAHLPARLAPNAVPVEVHFKIPDLDQTSELQAGARPFPGFPGLWRLGPADHLWHVLVHSVVTHPYRRGCLRDVVLTSTAVGECSPAELESVASRIARHPQRNPLGAMLELAQAVGRGKTVLDRFSADAAANYLLRSRFSWLSGLRVLEATGNMVFVMLGSRSERRAEWVRVLGQSEVPSPWRLLAAMERRWPRLGETSRRLLRTARLALLRPLAWHIAASASRLAKRFPRGAEPADLAHPGHATVP